ncbi:MAG TPA: hypothetical protein VGL04_07160 [Sporichthyaceae bacterium]|jgi:hypothetical protein
MAETWLTPGKEVNLQLVTSPMAREPADWDVVTGRQAPPPATRSTC